MNEPRPSMPVGAGRPTDADADADPATSGRDRREALTDGDRSAAGSTYGDWAPEGGGHSPIDPLQRGGGATAGADVDAPGAEDAPDLDPDDPDFELARARIAEQRGMQRWRSGHPIEAGEESRDDRDDASSQRPEDRRTGR